MSQHTAQWIYLGLLAISIVSELIGLIRKESSPLVYILCAPLLAGYLYVISCAGMFSTVFA